MKTTRETTWSVGKGQYETLPSGTDVKVIDRGQVNAIAGKVEGPAVLACADRMAGRGERVVFGVVGNVRCFTDADFNEVSQ